MPSLSAPHVLTAAASRIRSVVARSVSAARRAPDRGDVPGWVLVTLMTAGLVVAIWAVAGPALTSMFSEALESVTGP